MIRKVTLLAVGALMGATAVSAINSFGGSAEAAGAATYRQLAIFGNVFERVRAQYVTPPEEEKLIESAIDGMLTSLDPHSSYLNQEAADDMRTQTRGEFGGLGIEVTMEDELVKVITPIDETPAARAGVLAGDFISEIDGEPVRGLSLGQAVDKMRGPVNTAIELTILREGADQPIKIKVVRDIIAVKAVRFRVEEDVGYLRVISFTEKTYDDLSDAIDTITEEVGEDKLKGFVLDLRLNPGGLLDQAISVSDAFLDRGEIVSTRGRNPEETRRFNSRPGDLTGGKPVIVMINGGSASALRDRCRSAAGSPPRHHSRHPFLRQGVGPDHHSAGLLNCPAADHGALLHTFGNLDPGHRHQTGYPHRAADSRRASWSRQAIGRK
jgi:carboxyl-terminal processing protease